MWVIEEGALPREKQEGPLAGIVVPSEEVNVGTLEVVVEGGVPMAGKGEGRYLATVGHLA